MRKITNIGEFGIGLEVKNRTDLTDGFLIQENFKRQKFGDIS